VVIVNVAICLTAQSRGRGRGTWHDMLRSPFMWLISLSYLLVFLGRTATLDWAQLYLVHDLGHSLYVGLYDIASNVDNICENSTVVFYYMCDNFSNINQVKLCRVFNFRI